MTQFSSEARQIALSVGIVVLMISAGCSSFLTDGSPPPETTATEEATTTEGPVQQGTMTPSGSNTSSNSTNLSASGDDLRSVTIPENNSEQNTYYGEIDGNDSVIDGTNQYYEPILFAAEAGDTVNVSMSSIAHDPELRLRSPNGTTVAIDDDGGNGNDARFELLELNQTGQYTLVAAAAAPNTGFDYTLTVERNISNPVPDYAETERSRYEEFAEDYILYAQFQSGGQEGYIYNLTDADPEGNLTAITEQSANATTDEAAVAYYMEENATTQEAIDIDVSLLQSYSLMYESYIADDGSIENASWAPDRIYLVAYTYDGELFRVSYLEREWAVDYYEAGIGTNSSALLDYSTLHWATIHQGPAHPEYTEGGPETTDPDQPLGVYANESSAIQAE